jgi:DNA-binding transcriptional regulator YhcF (GntR family)
VVHVDPFSPVPPYEQIRTQIARQVASGELPRGTRLATVRQMAADLDLAVNTVARAFRELETDGVVVTRGRQGTFVRSDALDSPPPALDELARSYAAAARRHGLTCAEAVRLVEGAWSS